MTVGSANEMWFEGLHACVWCVCACVCVLVHVCHECKHVSMYSLCVCVAHYRELLAMKYPVSLQELHVAILALTLGP